MEQTQTLNQQFLMKISNTLWVAQKHFNLLLSTKEYIAENNYLVFNIKLKFFHATSSERVSRVTYYVVWYWFMTWQNIIVCLWEITRSHVFINGRIRNNFRIVDWTWPIAFRIHIVPYNQKLPVICNELVSFR